MSSSTISDEHVWLTSGWQLYYWSFLASHISLLPLEGRWDGSDQSFSKFRTTQAILWASLVLKVTYIPLDVSCFKCVFLRVSEYVLSIAPRFFLAKSHIITSSVTHRSSLQYLQASSHCTQTPPVSMTLNGALSSNAGWLHDNAPLWKNSTISLMN